jgi:hypothetical protein
MDTQKTREIVDQFFSLMDAKDHDGAAQVLADLCSKGERRLAGYILQRVATLPRTVSVTQTAHTVEAGSTVIGYQG